MDRVGVPAGATTRVFIVGTTLLVFLLRRRIHSLLMSPLVALRNRPLGRGASAAGPTSAGIATTTGASTTAARTLPRAATTQRVEAGTRKVGEPVASNPFRISV